MRKEDMVSDTDLRKSYNVDAEGAYLDVDLGTQTSSYSGKQEQPSTTTSKPGAASRGGEGY